MAGCSDPTLSRSRLNLWQRGLAAALLMATASLQAALAAPTLYVGRIITMDPTRPFS